MSYCVFKHPGVQLDLMVRQECWPIVVSYLDKCECSYAREEQIDHGNGDRWVRIIDIQCPHPWKLADFISMLYGIDWDAMQGDQLKKFYKDKFYIIMNPKRRMKNNDQKHRKETGAGSQGGDQAEPGDIRPGSDPEPGGAGDHADLRDADGLEGIEVPDSVSPHDDCRQ